MLAASIQAIATAESHQVHGQKNAKASEQQAVALERLLRGLGSSELGGGELGEGIVRDYGNGLKGVRFKLSESLRAELARSAGAKNVMALANGHQISDPSSASTMINAVLSNLSSTYNFWWGVVNLTSNDVALKTTWKLKGPRGGLKFKESATVTYPASSIEIKFDSAEGPLGVAGVYRFMVSIARAGKIKSWFYAE